MVTKEESDTDGPNVAEDGLSKDGTYEVGHIDDDDRFYNALIPGPSLS